MLNTQHPQPLKDLVYCCQSFLHWHDEYDSEQEWSALQNEANFRERMRELLPQCLELIKNDVQLIDCE